MNADAAPAPPRRSTADIAAEVARHRHGRVPRELRLEQVMAVAEELFAEEGYLGASMDELARRVGVSKPVIYDLVGSKEQLFHSVMDRFGRELAESVVAAGMAEPDPERRLRAGALAFFRFVAEHRAGWMVAGAGDGAPLSEGLAGVRRRQGELVAAILSMRFPAGTGPVGGLTASAAAQALNGAFEALAVWWRDHPTCTPEQLADLIDAMVRPGLDRLAAG